METTFFQQIAGLNLTGDLQLIISKGADSNLIVSVLLLNEQCRDKAKRLIPRLNLRGTAAELDSGFFQRITTPMQTASGLMVNMEAFMKQLEEVKRQSAMEKEKQDKEKKAKEEKDKKYKDAMKKVEELEKEGKYREAWIKVPEPDQFPEHSEDLRKRRAALSAKFSPGLFDTPVAAAVVTQQQTANTLSFEDHEEPEEPEEDYEEEENETE